MLGGVSFVICMIIYDDGYHVYAYIHSCTQIGVVGH